MQNLIKPNETVSYASFFTGVGGFELALHKIFQNAKCMAWSEIDKNSIKTMDTNFPQNSKLNIGDIVEYYKSGEYKDLMGVDFLFAGFPCQDLSIAKSNREGLKGKKSGLFWTLLDIIKEVKPKNFLIENVASMPVVDRDIITKELGVEPKKIISVNFTGQKRERLYWCNWDIADLPSHFVNANNHIDTSYIEKDKNYIIEYDDIKYDSMVKFRDNWKPDMGHLACWSKSTRYPKNKPSYVEDRVTTNFANTLTTGKGCGAYSSRNFVVYENGYRHLNPEECEKIQGMPVGWTSAVSRNQRYKQIGNSVTIPVIEHIFKGLLIK